MSEEINHFSHEEHPLLLSQVDKKIICYGCQEQILEPTAYCCFPCDFFLHKRCAELPRQIRHPKHSQHPLILLKEPPQYYHSYYCDGCGQKDWKYFTFHCISCDFDLHVSCATADDKKFEHEIGDCELHHKSHEHPLTLQQRPAVVFCDACHFEEEDSSYICTTCPFWIHKRCSSLPETVKHKHHNHSLTLAYCLPDENHRFSQKCTVCHRKVLRNLWVYYCGPCRYFVHIKCVKVINGSSPMLDGELDSENEEQYGYKQNLIKLPSPHAVGELINHFLLEENQSSGSSSSEKKVEEKIFLKAHKHPLFLSKKDNVQTQDEIKSDQEEAIQICDCCTEPTCLSDQHYACTECHYFLHETCSKLPIRLKITKHPDHPLLLKCISSAAGYFKCGDCKIWGNGSFYKCETCKLRICIKCVSASATPSVAHNAHKHPLTQFRSSNPIACSACGFRRGNFGFGCEDCHFYLDYWCALLPPTHKRRRHDHPLILIYPLYFEHPDEFYCVICEREMNPNEWMYHCRDCDYSLHPCCIPRFEWFRYVKFGRSLCVNNHSHPLTHIQETKYLPSCEGCNKSLDREEAFECDACGFYLCPHCAIERELPPS